MQQIKSDFKLIRQLCFRLLPVQILLVVLGSVNGIVSSLFASNFVGPQAMSAVGLYGPVGMFLGAVSLMLVGGAQIVCGRYMGQNQLEKTQNVFSLSLGMGLMISVLMTGAALAAGALGRTGLFTADAGLRPQFNRYLMGSAIGIVPLIVGQQLSGFLSLENQTRLTTAAGVAYILANLLFNWLFVIVLKLEVFGLALATSLGLWVFLAVQALYYLSGRSALRLRLGRTDRRESIEILRIGIPGALGYGYQTLRGFVVNGLILAYVGSAGLSAFAASNSFLCLFWAIPGGMKGVSRMLISVSVGEEDRQSLQDVMRVMFRSYLPLMFAVAFLLTVSAEPLTRLYYRDASDPVYLLTLWGFRIFPWSMPLTIICDHFLCYAQVSGKGFLMHLLPLLDGLAGVALFAGLLVPVVGMKGVYWANVLSGLWIAAVILVYAWIRNRRFPRTMAELMVIPADFGVAAEDRMDITLRSMEEVLGLSRRVQSFCRAHGIDERRAFFAALAVEEMAGNIVEHGFHKDKKKHSVDLRIACKDEELILRFRDDCMAFDPVRRQHILDPEDPAKNIGIRMVGSLARDIHYQNILGLNVLTVKI